ncbi:sodium/potassium-transporting ATPase subunit beta-like [Macrobrachium rosenbergii]|uniref:sodium/potassium-transporting ATPase subunit beta-like n=1 Tax=Macrobrachium rosenbergii TaxID=79674 RepID=UPI0034D395AE
MQKDKGFIRLFWNSETKEFLGRTGASWCKIGLFYLGFFSSLVGFFAILLAFFYQTLDTEHMPTYIPGDGGSILRNPAMGYRPSPQEDNIESTLIWYRNGEADSISHWVKSLSDYIEPYEGVQGSNFIECKNEKRPTNNEVCKFMDTWLEGNCTKSNSWGYTSGSPCIFIKLNKMIGWVPDLYESLDELPQDMSDDLKNHITEQTKQNGNVMPKMIWVSCEGENPSDEEYAGARKYSPWRGFPSYYFPFNNTPGYLSPIVAVEFESTRPNVLINIECRAWARNILHNRAKRYGLVSFQILRD